MAGDGGIRFSKEITLGTLISTLTVLSGIVVGVWHLSSQYQADLDRTTALAASMQQMRETRDHEIAGIRADLHDESEQRQRSADTIGGQMDALSRRIDELLRQKRTELGLPPETVMVQ